MNRAKFFDELRGGPLFGGRLSQSQVQGVEAILDKCAEYGADLGQTAYIEATGYGETGGSMVPKRENMNYSARRIPQVFGVHRRQGIPVSRLAGNPELLANTVYGGDWGRKHLGNTEPTDGWDFRGWGIGQWTGRRNTAKAAKQVGMDLLSDPSLLDSIDLNAELLVKWMMEGGATGRKLPEFVSGNRRDYHSARQVWGGVEPAKYARHARVFEAALNSAGMAA